VRDSAAYILVIGLKYGQTPECPDRNPDRLSVTELEFNEAQELDRPTLLFIMGDDHPVTKKDIERDPEKEAKLNAFRERAKKASQSSDANRVYAEFNSLEEFKDRFASSLTELTLYLNSSTDNTPKDDGPPASDPQPDAIPSPPDFYAEPDYIGSHQFVGRAREREELSDWASPADPTNLLLYEAIGGNGKSMLTWEWTINHATQVRTGEDDWAGRFWYSFYERGAIMADFCQRALSYMTGQPLQGLLRALRNQLVMKFPGTAGRFGIERPLLIYKRA
jgi:hypothetical protein